LHVLRGRLRLIPQVRQHSGRVDPLEVAFDEFETDIPENRILAAALDATRPVVRTHFETFVARLVAAAFEPMGIRVHSQRRDPSIIIDEATGKRYASIIPDLLLEARIRGVQVRLPVDAKYKVYDQRKIDESDVYQTFFYAFAYAAETHGHRRARAVILFPRAGDGSDASLRVDTHAGHQSARIQAFGVDIEGALDAVGRGGATITNVPALGRLHQALHEVLADVVAEDGWLASSA
jgi:5-methylcytosine-specific restriction endonuclease McrBC regulatory subunit McrC